MLYIKFNIQDSSKYKDFQKLYAHMVKTRQPGFNFQEDDDSPDIDWDSMTTQKEIDAAVKELSDYLDLTPEFHRSKKFIPTYANEYLETYLQFDSEKHDAFSVQDPVSIFNYLECGFEVDMTNLEKENEKSGLVEFSTGNFPFGGLERFLITLKAFDIIPTECFDGYSICELQWTSNFEYNTIEYPKRTKAYLKRNGVLKTNQSEHYLMHKAKYFLNTLFLKNN